MGKEKMGLGAFQSERKWTKRNKIRFSHFDSPDLGAFWQPRGEVLRDVLCFFKHVKRTLHFYLVLLRFQLISAPSGQAKIIISLHRGDKNASFLLLPI